MQSNNNTYVRNTCTNMCIQLHKITSTKPVVLFLYVPSLYMHTYALFPPFFTILGVSKVHVLSIFLISLRLWQLYG